ncbi:MAG: hypothetical protein KG029_07810 [Bacteroidetes bacterium]|nr:hypothetical protein [Bacteroidota bacterium]
MESKSSKSIEIPEVSIKQVAFKIRGISPLIVNRWSEKAKQELLDSHMKKAKKGHDAKDPQQIFMSSLYKFKDGKRTGFPAVAFKAAMIRAGKSVDMVMTDLRAMFFIHSDEDGLVEIDGTPSMREDMVRLNGGKPDVRFRGEYKDWAITLRISYNSKNISPEQLASLIELAGFGVGVGEWRPEKSASGTFGLFELEKS